MQYYQVNTQEHPNLFIFRIWINLVDSNSHFFHGKIQTSPDKITYFGVAYADTLEEAEKIMTNYKSRFLKYGYTIK